jgi:hypothetical protein
MDAETWKAIFKGETYNPISQLGFPQHPDVRDQILNFYNDELKRVTGFDYSKSRQEYIDIGNNPGMYADVGLIFHYLLKEYKPRKIVELGSGFSTLVLSHLIRSIGLNSEFISYEQSDKYGNQTAELLEKYGFSKNIIHLCDMFPENNLVGDANFVFLDCQYRSYLLSEKADWFKNLDILILDDSQAPTYSIDLLYEFMNKTNRHCFMMLNGAGRTDMTEFISYKKELEPNVAYYLNHVMGYL